MTHSPGRHALAIPGPSVIPERVLQAMIRPAPDIYEGPFVEMVPGLIADLKAVARSRHQAAIYIGNGHAAWEAALANVIAPGDSVLVAATGLFGHGWAEVARGLGARVRLLDFGTAAPAGAQRVAEALVADRQRRIRALLVCHVDTSSSLRSDIAALRRALDESGHPALLMVDAIASLGCERLETDSWGIDVLVAASQKGLMCPPGLGLVFFNDRAEAARARCAPSRYWDWRPRARPESFYQHFAGTAPTHHLFALRAALDMIREEGLEAAWARHARLAAAVWAAADAWGRGGPLRLHLRDPALRAHSVTTLSIGAVHGTRLRRWLTENAGVTLGIGLGMGTKEDPRADGFFRIGHMGHVNAQMLLGVLGAIEAGLTALEIPHGTGAVEAAAAVLAAG